MKRAIKFKLKNGRVVTIRRLKLGDYGAFTKYMKDFSNGAGARWTWRHPDCPIMSPERAEKAWSDENNLFIAAFDVNKIIGMADVSKQRPNHPYSGRVAGMATTMLDRYTSNGLGTKFTQIIEKWALEHNVHKLQADVRHKNIRSLGNLLKLGYEVVGILHDTAFIDGEWHHEYILEKILEK